MAEGLTIRGDGTFEISGKAYRIPDSLSPREVFSYRRLLEPIPDIPGGTSLTVEQRQRQRAYLFRRAAACVVPGLEASALESVSVPSLVTLHRWITSHRPEVALNLRTTG